MAITLDYGASPSVIGPAAYDAGRGIGLREQQDALLRQQQMAEQVRQFNEQQALNQQRFGEGQREFDVSQAFDQQKFGMQFGEGQRQFDTSQAFDHERFAAQNDLSQRQFAAQTDLNQKQFTEGQKEFGSQQSLREQQAAADREAQQFNQRLAGHKEQLAKYGLMQQGYQADANRQAQYAETDLRGQYGLAGDAMGYQTQLLREQMQQQGENQRQDSQMQGRFGLQFQEQAAKEMQVEWANIQKALPSLDPAERQELIAKFQDHWQNSQVPMPTELPPQDTPEWQDPQKQWDKASAWAQAQEAKGYHVNLVPDKNGMPSIMRGTPQYAQTPEGMALKHQHEMEKQQVVTGAKDQAEQQKFYRDAVSDETKQQHDDQNFNRQQRQSAISVRLELQVAIAKARSDIAKAKTPHIGADGTASPTPDMTDAEAEIANLQAMLQSITVPQEWAPPGSPSGGLPADFPMTPGMQSPSSGPPQWYLDLPSGATYTAPDGTKRVKP